MLLKARECSYASEVFRGFAGMDNRLFDMRRIVEGLSIREYRIVIVLRR